MRRSGSGAVLFLLLARAVAAQDSDKHLEAWLGTLGAPKAVRGDGVFSGVVRGPGGKPLVGVEVIAHPGWSFLAPYPPNPTLEQELAWQARLTRWRTANGGRATTDAAGRFRIEGLARRTFNFGARKQGYIVEVVHGSASAAPDRTVDFFAIPSARLIFDVRLPDGSPAPSASIDVRGVHNFARTWNPAMPASDLRTGHYRIIAYRGQYRDQRSEPVLVQLKAGDAPRRVVLPLKEDPGLRGTIRFPAGFQPVHLAVSAIRFVGEQPPAPEKLFAGHTNRTPVSGRSRSLATPMTVPRYPVRAQVNFNDYSYRFSGLEPGRYLVGLTLDRKRAFVTAVAVVEEGGVTVQDLRLPPLEEQSALEIRIRGPYGGPVRQVFFNCESQPDRLFRLQPLGILDGVYLVRPPGADALKDAQGPLRIHAHSYQYGIVKRFWKRGERKLDIAFKTPATVEVVLKEPADPETLKLLRVEVRPRGHPGYRLEPFASAGIVPGGYRRSSIGDRSKLFGPYQPTPLEVVIGVASGGGIWPTHTYPVDPKPGFNRIVVELPKAHEVHIIGRKNANLVIELARDKTLRRQIRLDQHGQGHIKGLPAGSYFLVNLDSGNAWRIPFKLPREAILRTPRR